MTEQTRSPSQYLSGVASQQRGLQPDELDELARLPHGRHGLPAEFVARNQRSRLLVGLVQVVAEHGYNGTTITRVVERAGVTSRTFYKHFKSVEDCYLTALEATFELLGETLAEAWAAEREWPRKVRAALLALLETFAASPELARLCLVEPFVAGPAISGRYQEASERLEPYLREGRELSDAPEALPASTERGLLGSVGSQIGRKVSAGEAEGLPALLPELTQFALTPYLGIDGARRVASGS